MRLKEDWGAAAGIRHECLRHECLRHGCLRHEGLRHECLGGDGGGPVVRRAATGLHALWAAVGLGAMFAAADAAWGQAGAPNLSSHSAAFFEDLLAGRVWVLERPNSRLAGDRGTVWAHYHAPDGTLLACAHLGGGYAGAEARWRVVPSRAFRALYNYLEPDAEPDPGRRHGHTPIFYEPDTGALHNEALAVTLVPETAAGACRLPGLGAGELAGGDEGGVSGPGPARFASGQPAPDRDRLCGHDGAGPRFPRSVTRRARTCAAPEPRVSPPQRAGRGCRALTSPGSSPRTTASC